MFRQSSKWLVVVLASGVLVAGCGSSSSSSSSSTSAPSGAAGATTSSTSTAGTTSSTTTPSGPGVSQAVAQCKALVHQAPTLSSSTKAKIEGICDKAATDPAAAKTAAKEVCVEVVNSSPIPSGSIKEKALAACKSR
jgi:hypothetical protein